MEHKNMCVTTLPALVSRIFNLYKFPFYADTSMTLPVLIEMMW